MGLVSLLFTDLVASTELLERLGDDEFESLRRRHFRLLRQAITGGHEVKNLGDGLMVAFPSAVDALYSAVAMQQAVHRERLPIRIGLHAGEVIEDGGDYFGTPVVIAQRLCARAEGGQIVTSDLVKSIVGSRGGYCFTPLGALVLKGLSEDILAHAVSWAPEAERERPFVGREAEMALLGEALADAVAGKGRVVLLAGEPGIGKTRLAEELEADAVERGAQVLWGRCHEGEGAPSYWPWVQILRSYLAVTPRDLVLADLGPATAAIADIAVEIRDLLPDVAPLPALDPDAERFRFFDALAGMIGRVSARQPAMLVIEDIHWADTATLLLLQFLAKEMGRFHLLVLATYRDVEVGRTHPVRRTLAELARVDGCLRVPVRGLSEADVARFIEATTGRSPAADLARLVHAETEGNAFFVSEIVRLLGDEGLQGAPASLVVPQGVRDVIGRRLDHLAPATNEVLQTASVIGREFSLDLLEQTTGVSALDLLDALEEAEDQGLVTRDATGVTGYRFSHALVRETLYDELPMSRRVRTHHAVAEAIEHSHGDDVGPYAEILAHHYLQSAVLGDLERAVRYCEMAAARAENALAYEEAVSYLERAVEAAELRATDVATYSHLLRQLARAQVMSGNVNAAIETAARAVEAARQARSTELFVDAALAYPTLVEREPYRVKRALLEEAERLVTEPTARRSLVLSRLSNVLYNEPLTETFSTFDADRIVMYADEALSIARTEGHPRALLSALFARHYAAYLEADSAPTRLRLAEEMLRIPQDTEPIGDLEIFDDTGGKRQRRLALLEMAEVDAVRASLPDLTDLLGPPTVRWIPQFLAATLALVEGNLEEVERRWADNMAEIASWDPPRPDLLQLGSGQLLNIRWLQGRLGEIAPAAEEFAETYGGNVAWRSALGLIAVETGDLDAARRHLDVLAIHDFADFPRDWAWQTAVAVAAEVAARLGDRPRAALLFELLAPYEERLVIVVEGCCFGPAARHLGLLAATLGRGDEARRLLQRAVEISDAIGSPPFRAMAQADLAGIAEGEESVRLATDALATAERIGMAAVADRCRDLLDEN